MSVLLVRYCQILLWVNWLYNCLTIGSVRTMTLQICFWQCYQLSLKKESPRLVRVTCGPLVLPPLGIRLWPKFMRNGSHNIYLSCTLPTNMGFVRAEMYRQRLQILCVLWTGLVVGKMTFTWCKLTLIKRMIQWIGPPSLVSWSIWVLLTTISLGLFSEVWS